MSVLVRGKGGVGEGGNEGPKLAEHRMKNRLQYCVVECREVLMESPLGETATIPSVHPSIHPSLSFSFLSVEQRPLFAHGKLSSIRPLAAEGRRRVSASKEASKMVRNDVPHRRQEIERRGSHGFEIPPDGDVDDDGDDKQRG